MNHFVVLSLFVLSISSISFCDSTTCVPKCRGEYFCKNGECVSKCNPPCPSEFICAGEMGCITKDQYSELTETHYGKILLTSFLTLGGIGITITGHVVEHNQNNGLGLHTSKTDILATKVIGPILFTLSIPLNLLTWNKFLKARKFRKEHNISEI